jgi:hypothetical protein
MRKDPARTLQQYETIPKMIAAGMARPDEFRGMVQEFDKPAGERCPHQRTGKGCAIYAKRPFGCRFWNCRWLGDPENTRELPRPDRCGYVIDIMPDFITVTGNGEPQQVEVIQVWVDPKRPLAHRDPALRDFLDRQKRVALIRLNESDAFALWPPSLCPDQQWHELGGESLGRSHTADEICGALAG